MLCRAVPCCAVLCRAVPCCARVIACTRVCRRYCRECGKWLSCCCAAPLATACTYEWVERSPATLLRVRSTLRCCRSVRRHRHNRLATLAVATLAMPATVEAVAVAVAMVARMMVARRPGPALPSCRRRQLPWHSAPVRPVLTAGPGRRLRRRQSRRHWRRAVQRRPYHGQSPRDTSPRSRRRHPRAGARRWRSRVPRPRPPSPRRRRRRRRQRCRPPSLHRLARCRHRRLGPCAMACTGMVRKLRPASRLFQSLHPSLHPSLHLRLSLDEAPGAVPMPPP